MSLSSNGRLPVTYLMQPAIYAVLR